MSKFFELLKIGGGMFAAYIFVVIVGARLFMPNSPEINMQYIASLREIPSYTKVQLASLGSLFKNKDAVIQKEVDTFKKKTGAVEIAVSKEEQKTLVDSVGQTTNPAPNAVFNYMSKGVAASAPDAQGKVILRVDENTQQNIKYKQFTRPDGSVLEIMILP